MVNVFIFVLRSFPLEVIEMSICHLTQSLCRVAEFLRDGEYRTIRK